MNDLIQKYTRIGTVMLMAHPELLKGGSVLDVVKRFCNDAYFTALELANVPIDERAKVRALAETADVTLYYGGQMNLMPKGLNINDLNEDGRQAALKSVKAGIDEAYELGCKTYAFLSGKYDPATAEQSYQKLVESTFEMCEYVKTKNYNMPLRLEVFDFDIDKKSLIGPASLARRYAQQITAQYPDFGLMVDLSHFPLLHETIEEAVLPVKDYIKHVHIGNGVVTPGCVGYGDLHPRFGFPNGGNDVKELTNFLRMLFHIGYLDENDPKVISFEVKPWKDEDPDTVVAHCKRKLNQAWARL